MVQHTRVITGALTTAPNLWADLKTEPPLPPMPTSGAPASKQAVNSSFLSSFTDVAAGIMPGFPSIYQPIGIGAIGGIAGLGGMVSGSILNPMTNIAALLSVNSPSFYSVIGAAMVAMQPMGAIVAQAQEVNKDYPSLWYLNFPRNLSEHNKEVVQLYRQSMLDFRSWSSGKWWQEVNRRYGNPSDMVARVQQSKEFATIACEDSVKMSWLQTTQAPFEAQYHIDCKASELHDNIISKALSNWSVVTADTMQAIEPLLQDIVRSGSGTATMSQLKVVILEKYVYNSNTDSITSYIRLICFELREAFYNVVRNKEPDESRVSVDMSLLQYEAIFNVSLWNQYSDTLQPADKDIFKDFIQGQTIDLK